MQISTENLEFLHYWANEMTVFMDKGGYIMYPLFLLTMLLWYCIGYRYWLLRRSRVPLYKLMHNHRSCPRDVVEQAVIIGREVKTVHQRHLRRRLDAEFYPLEHEVQRFSSVIKSSIVVAPSLGLLGTVSGMIETFDSLAEMNIYGQSSGIAGGIAEALYATQMGLAVAIPAVLVKLWLDLKQKSIQSELEQIKDLLCIDS